MPFDLILRDSLSGKEYYFDLFLNPLRFVKKSQRPVFSENLVKEASSPKPIPSYLRELRSLLLVHFIQEGWQKFCFNVLISDKKHVLANESGLEYYKPVVSHCKELSFSNSRAFVEFLLEGACFPLKVVPKEFRKILWALYACSSVEIYIKVFEKSPGFVPLRVFKPDFSNFSRLFENEKFNAIASMRGDVIKMAGLIDLLEFNKMLDCGSGYGALLVPLAVLNPKKHFVGVEPDRERTKLCEHSIQLMKLKNVTLIESKLQSAMPLVGSDVDLVSGLAISDGLERIAVSFFSGKPVLIAFYRGQFSENGNIFLLNAKHLGKKSSLYWESDY